MSRRSRKRWLRSREEIGALLEEFDRSGVSAARFADEHELSISTLHWWLRRRRDRAAAPRSPTRFVAVRLPRAGLGAEPSLEVVLTSGRRVHVPAGFDVERLSAMLAAIDVAC